MEKELQYIYGGRGVVETGWRGACVGGELGCTYSNGGILYSKYYLSIHLSLLGISLSVSL